MQGNRKRLQQTWAGQRNWLLAVVAVTSLSLLLLLAPSAQAVQTPQTAKDGLAQSQIYNDDLEVESGQTLEGDINVYSGDVTVRREGRIQGDLNVYSGNVTIEEGGYVTGNVTAWSGDLQVDGRVDGSIAATSGDIAIGDAAIVGGDVSVISGNIKQRAGAAVSGNILRGRELQLPAPPAVRLLPWLNAPQASDASVLPNRDLAGNRPLGFVGRALTALLLLGLFVGGAAAVMALRPAWTGEVQAVLGRKAALSFATGLIANVLMLAIIGFLFVTVCLIPPALLLGLGLLAFNIAGMAAVGAEIGVRLSERLRGEWTPPARTALGVVAPGAAIAFLWAVGGCFGFFGGAGALLLGSFGVGAILVKALNLGEGSPAAAPAGGPAPAATPASTAPETQAPGPAATSAPDASWWQSAAATQEAPPREQAAAAAPVDAPQASAAPSAAPSAGEPELLPMVQADFTKLEGIGPKLNQRLHAANIHTFADLAALPPETLAGILGWSSERLLRSGVIERAQELAG